MSRTFNQGWGAEPFKQQFPEMSDKDAAHLDRLNHAITDMLLSNLITQSQADNIRQKRFPKLVAEYLNRAPGKGQ